MVIVAKSIGGGLPLGALITNNRYSNVFESGDHGSTFGGNPVACVAGLAVIDEVFENSLVNEVAKLGDYFLKELKMISGENSDKIIDIRGLGFMLGVEFNQPCSAIVEEFRGKGILVNCTNDNVLRILPPLISTQENIEHFLNEFRLILNKKIT